jgi:hypothetical protein
MKKLPQPLSHPEIGRIGHFRSYHRALLIFFCLEDDARLHWTKYIGAAQEPMANPLVNGVFVPSHDSVFVSKRLPCPVIPGQHVLRFQRG